MVLYQQYDYELKQEIVLILNKNKQTINLTLNEKDSIAKEMVF